MKKSRVLFLLHLPGPIHGSSIVGQSIYDSEIINSEFECHYINLLVSGNLNETGKLFLGKIFKSLFIWFKVLGLLLFKRPNLCYFALTANGAAFFRDCFIVILLKLFRVECVYHLHNKGYGVRRDIYHFKILQRIVFSDSNVIILSKRLYDDISLFVPLSRVFICPNGIPLNKSKGRIQDPASEKEVVRILFLSNLFETKGVFYLLEAMSLLNKAKLPFLGIFVGGEGDISEHQFNNRVRELQLQDRVSYLGRKIGEEKEKIFETADIFAFPTYYQNETFGLVNLEAMQHSLPIVSTDEGGIPDIVEDGVTGFIVPKRNVEALFRRLESLIIDPNLRQKMGHLGFLKFEKLYTFERFEVRIVQILNTCLKK